MKGIPPSTLPDSFGGIKAALRGFAAAFCGFSNNCSIRCIIFSLEAYSGAGVFLGDSEIRLVDVE